MRFFLLSSHGNHLVTLQVYVVNPCWGPELQVGNHWFGLLLSFVFECALQASSSIFVSLLLLVLPLESLFHGLFYELGNSLGGTCVGYAVVIPTNYCR